MMYGRGVDTGIQESLSARLASLLMASQESCNSVVTKHLLIGALSADMPRTSAGLIWRLQCAQVLEQARSLGKAIELLEALLGDVDGQYR